MSTIQRFEDLEVWKIAREFYQKLLPIVESLKKNKDFRFADQVKSAAGSVMDNIAEGFERNSRLEFINSLGIAKGETGENRSQLYRLLDGKHITEIEFKELYDLSDKLSRKLANFVKYLNNVLVKGLKFKDRKLSS